MAFSINQLNKINYEGGEEDQKALEDYQDALLEIFSQSAEGQALLESAPDTELGFWAAQLINYGYVYEGVTIPKMTVGILR
jgi:hypothetical protein